MGEAQTEQMHARGLAEHDQGEHRDGGEGRQRPVARQRGCGEQPGDQGRAEAVDEERADARSEAGQGTDPLGRQPQRGAADTLLRGWFHAPERKARRRRRPWSGGVHLPATRRGPCYRAETLGTPGGNPPLVTCKSPIAPLPEDRCSPAPTRSPPTSATTTSSTSTSASATCPASCSTSPSRRRRSARTRSPRGSGSTAPRSPGSRRSTSPTCCCCPTPTAPSSTRSAGTRR